MKISIINTGGTIDSIGDPLGPMPAEKFAEASQKILNPIIKRSFPDVELDYVTDLKFSDSSTGTLDSTNLQPIDWCIMAEYILEHYDCADGWIILHGTDTMDFTGSALPFLLSSFDEHGIPTAVLNKPVIITGSQVPMYDYKTDEDEKQKDDELILRYNTDAFQNFCGAVASARSGIPEVGVFFHNYLFRGNRVLKTNASEFDAFSSPNFPAIAESGIEFTIHPELVLAPPVSYDVSFDNPAILKEQLAQVKYIKANIDNFPVMQFNAFPAWYKVAKKTASGKEEPSKAFLACLIDACVAQGLKGLILESYGEGNFPSGDPNDAKNGAIYQALHTANFTENVVIVDCTQVISGTVNNTAYASGAWLPSVGALNSADMTSMAAFAKLMILLTMAEYKNWSLDTVKTLVQMDLRGEMISVNRLDSRGRKQLLSNQEITSLDGSTSLVNDPMLGPVLKNNKSGSVLWRVLDQPTEDHMPGRLIMQNDGNLVFYSDDNDPLWATNTGNPNGASSMLILSGAEKSKTLKLEVYNYSKNEVSAVLYEQ